ncbi:hypothetical protein RAB80_017956 [Fusarium oxysporum f. sp. vasinfectum]|nr:hypothetical protein RAB80_017956 [Fusarium oxysporum f. sp. vasinfectum]
MAPRLSDADHEMMEAMIQRGETTKQIAQAIPCDPQTVQYFPELKNYIKKPGPELSELFKKDFRAFLQACVESVGKRKASARGHFRHAGLAIDEYTEEM